MKHSTFSILFYIKKTKLLKTGEAPVYLRITVNGLRSELSIKRSILPNIWNEKKENAMGNSIQSDELNKHIMHLKNKIYKCQRDLEDRNIPITAKEIRSNLIGHTNESKGIIEVFKDHNQDCAKLKGRDFAPATITRYETCLMHVQNFIKQKYKDKDLALKLVNFEFIKDFELYLKTKKKCNHNTTVKYLRNFRKIIRLALAYDWIKSDPFRNIRYKLQEVDVEYLTREELERLMKKEFEIDRIEKIRDIFVFCCFTSLAYSDVKELQHDNIETGIDGKKWIKKKRKKTKKWCSIPLHPVPLAILEKYKNHPICQISGKLLPVKTNQKTNAYLKEIADICEIKKNLSTHTARHTFATTVTLSNGVSIEAVSKMMGHSSILMTKKYARVVEELISKEMEKVESKFIYPAKLIDETGNFSRFSHHLFKSNIN